MKKIISIIIVMMFIFTTVFADAPSSSDDYITRAEMAKITSTINGIEESRTQQRLTVFRDVPMDFWASGHIQTAVEFGIIRGFSDGTFKPYDTLTYEQAIAMIMRALGYSSIGQFSLVTTYGGFPTGYLYVATQIGLTYGLDFELGQNIMRKDIATIINRALDVPIMMYFAFSVPPMVMNGLDGRELITLRIYRWDNSPVYFDGWEFVVLDDVVEEP